MFFNIFRIFRVLYKENSIYFNVKKFEYIVEKLFCKIYF